ncbi:MAG TPA: inositol monophosphatase family protein [Longimicrobiales bacterium]|nr:inositol monophosphatase family protein [Longimicrobiales bacterium]
MNELLSVAREAAQGAVRVHREHLGRVEVADWSQKGVADFVTHVDRAAESVIVERITAHFPGHRLLAEEAAAERGGSHGVRSDGNEDDWTWIIDPLDGTTNYLHGYPAYAVSIAVARGGELQAAVVRNGATGEEWSAIRNGGAFLDGSRIAVSQIEDMPRALIGTGFPFKALHLLPAYTRQLEAALRNTSGVRRAGSAALDLCHVATGWFDGFWELDLAPWDVAAGALIVREAGGVVTRLDGSMDVLGQGSLLAGNPVIHAALGDLMRSAAASADTIMT